MKNTLWDAFTAIFIVALLYLLVKPSSLGPSFIKGSTEALSTLITYSVAG